MLIRTKSLFAYLLATITWLSANTITTYTIPTSDGGLWDHNAPWNNQPDENDSLNKVAHVGSFFGKEYVAILEFPLPPASEDELNTFTSASLTLFTHQKGISPVSIEIFTYSDDNADGVVSMEDWDAGDSAGAFLTEGESEISALNRCPPFDVTEAVRTALKDGKYFIGFRLRAVDPTQTTVRADFKGVIVRLAEFGMDHPAYRPTLTLNFN